MTVKRKSDLYIGPVNIFANFWHWCCMQYFCYIRPWFNGTLLLLPHIDISKSPLASLVNIVFVRYIIHKYRQTSNIRHTKSQNVNVSLLVLQLTLPNPLKQALSQEGRCSWSSTDRRCSNYIWVISSFIAYWGVTYIRGLTVVFCEIRACISNYIL